MKMMNLAAMKRLCFYLASILLMSCEPDEERNCAFIPDTGSLTVRPVFESLEDSLPAIMKKSDLVRFMTRHPDTRDYFFNRSVYPNDSVFINRLFSRFSNPYIDTLLQETHRVFGNGQSLQDEFAQAYTNLNYYYPGYSPPRIQTLISGLETDLFVTDTAIYIGLDYFLGQGAKFRPNDMYDYILRRYTKHFIVPSVMLLTGVDSRFNKTNSEDKTVLAEMITYGKAYYFAKRMLPCVSDTLLMGYSAGEWEGSMAHENLIWSRLVQDEVLYSTNHIIKQRFLAERPRTLEVGEDCPGRIAQWIGWRIVEKFMAENPEITLPQLMAISDAQRIFKESGYKPRVVRLPASEKS
jgi:hypothetical protein